MKMMRKINVLTIVLILVSTFVNSQVTWERTAAGTHSWTAPCGVSKVTVELWGGGGAGGGVNSGNTRPNAGGGGAGGGYVKRVDYPVIPGNTYSIQVGSGGTGATDANGTAGQSSFFISNATISATGGNGGTRSQTANVSGAGGSAKVTGNVGFTTGFSFYGGAGGTGVSGSSGGGGGGSAGSSSNGNNGSATTGASAVTDGGAGGDAGSNGAGSAGSSPGGGGGGAQRNSNGGGAAGGAGAPGKVVLTYVLESGVDNIQNLVATEANNAATITFDIPGSSCRTEVLVVVRKDNSISATPSGDGSAYTANSVFGSGTAFGGGFVVAKGTSTSVNVTNLLNWEPYYVKVFTRLGTSWSSGVELLFYPSIPGYYWNGGNIAANPANGGTGTWATANAWRQPSLSGAQATWAGGSTGIIKGSSGVISLNGNVNASKVFVVDNGFTLTPNTTTTRTFTGDLELYPNIVFSFNDVTATASRTFSFLGDLTGGTNSKMQLNVNQTSGNNSVFNLASTGRSLNSPIEIVEGSNAGTKGFAIIYSSGGSNTISSSATITNNTSYPLSLGAIASETLTINAPIAGSGDIYFANGSNTTPGTVLLNASSNYSGKTFIRAASTGVVRLGINNALPMGTDLEFLATTGTFDLNGFNQSIGSFTGGTGGSITNTSVNPSILTISGINNATTFSRVINNGTGGISLVKSGTNTQNLGGANTYSGGLTINAGRVLIGVASSGSISSITSSFAGTGTLTMSGGALSSNGETARTILNPFTISGNITLGNASENGDLTVANVATLTGATRSITVESTVTFSNSSNAIADAGNGFTKLGSGTMAITGQATYTGITTVSDGILQLNRVGGATIPSSNNIVVDGGTLRVMRNQTINNLTLTSGTLIVDASVTLTINGTFTGGGTIQNDGTIVLVGPSAFPGATTTISAMNNLTVNRAGDVNMDADLTIAGTLTLTSGDFQIGNNSLTLNGPWIAGTPNNLKSTSNSKLYLNNTLATSTTFPNLGNLHTLGVNSDRTFNLQTTLSIHHTLALTNGTLNIGTQRLILIGSNLSRVSGVVTASGATSVVEFANSSPLEIPAGLFTVFGNLEMNSTSSVTCLTNVSVNNNLTFTSGAFNVNGNTLTYSGTNLTRTTGTINASISGSSLVFNGASTLTIPDGLFSHSVCKIIVDGPQINSNTDIEISEELNLPGSNPNATDGKLNMVQSYGSYATVRSSNSTDANNNLNSKVLTLAPTAVITGTADITGKIRRTGFVSGQDYQFGNENMLLRFDENGGTLPSEIMVVATKGTKGLHVDKDGVADFTPSTSDTLIGGAAVQRMWQILRTGGTNAVRFTVRFPYLDSELNGNNEANLVTWDHHIPYAGLTPHEHGKTNNNISENWVELSGHGLFYLAEKDDAAFTKYWMLSEKVTVDTLWLGASGVVQVVRGQFLQIGLLVFYLPLLQN